MATMVLLGYHLFIATFMGNKEVDTRLCKKILDDKVSTYPKGVFFLFFKGRYHLVQVHFERQNVKPQSTDIKIPYLDGLISLK